MNKRIAMTLVSLCCFSAFANDTPKIEVTSVQNIRTEGLYIWQVPGASPVFCFNSGCSAYYMPSSYEITDMHGPVLRFLLPDSRIVIAECVARPEVALNVMTTFAGAATTDYSNSPAVSGPHVYRSRMVPEADSTLEAEFDRNSVRLFIREPSIDRTASVSSENYRIIGTLQPNPTQQSVGAAFANPATTTQFKANRVQAWISQPATAADLMVGHIRTQENTHGIVEMGAESRSTILAKPAGTDVHIDANKEENVTVRRSIMADETGIQLALKSVPKNSEDRTKGVIQPSLSSQPILQDLPKPEIVGPRSTNIEKTKTSEIADLRSVHVPTPEESAQLEKAGQASRCLILTVPADAEIYIDNKKSGKSPILFTLVRNADSPRIITIKKLGYLTVEKEVIPDGDVIRINLNLEAERK
jgi:hypothetical protein